MSRQCAHRWVARFDAEGWAGLHDRSSRARSFPTRTPAEFEAAVVAARRDLRLGRDRIAEITGVPARTVSRILARHAMPAIGALDPVTGMLIRASTVTGLRYERAAPATWSTWTSRSSDASPTAAAGARTAPASAASTSTSTKGSASTTSTPWSTTTPAWPTPRSTRTRRDRPQPQSCCGPPRPSPPTASRSARSSATTPWPTASRRTSRTPSPP